MNTWQAALETALIGVTRKNWQLPTDEGELDALLRSNQTDQPALSLLHSIAILSVYRRAGVLPLADQTPANPAAPAETLPVCGPCVAFQLQQMLSGQFADLLPWTLEQLATARERVPSELLPSLLQYASTRPLLRESVRAVCGERGRWLATMNPAWNGLLSLDCLSVSLWETGSAPQRLAVLKQVRRSDPNQARALLESTWAQDKAEMRVQCLGVLEESLAAQDETFLDSRLDDRSLAVRQAAAELLALLPGSAYLQRMKTRLAALVWVERTGLLRSRTLALTLPETNDVGLLRDGIKGQSAPRGLGEKASALAQIIAAVEPSFWTAQFGLEPAQLLKAAAASEWKDLLWQGWQEATKRHGDVTWAQALVDALPSAFLDLQLLQLLPSAERDHIALRLVQDQQPKDLPDLVPRMPAPWSMAFTRAIIQKCQVPDHSIPALVQALRAAIVKMPPEAVQLVSPQWPSVLSEVAAGLEFFHRLHTDLQNNQ